MFKNIKRKSKEISLVILTIFYILFFLSIILVNGYPQTNDILHIFKITPLDGNLKFINGIYGPGYTYYSLIFSNNLTTLSFVICILHLINSFLLIKILDQFSLKKELNEKFIIYSISILFHMILMTTIGFNHSDSIFILLFYNGLLFFILGFYLNDNKFLYFIGLFILGISVLFRHHGPFALFLLFVNFLLFEYFCKDNFKNFVKKYILFAFILILPTILSQIHLYSIDAIVNWQTTFKLHFFFHGDKWGDWRDLKYVLQSEEVKNFNIKKVEFDHGLFIILNHLKGAIRITYPFIFIFLICFYISKNKIVFYSFLLFTIYILIVLAGYHRGYYPGIFFCFLSVIICYRNILKNKIAIIFISIFLLGHFIYLIEKYSSDVINKYSVNKDIKYNVVPILDKHGIEYRNIFSDDYEFYTTKLNGNIHEICNWGGWFLNHPYLKNYYPRDVLMGNNKDYCDVKILITKDKNLAEEYIDKEKFNSITKTNIYYLLM